jgi:hypothetical protein
MEKTFAYWCLAHILIPGDSELQQSVLENMATLAKTYEEWHYVYDEAPGDSAISQIAEAFMLTLAQRALRTGRL